MKKFIIRLINLYQKNPIKKHPTCVFIPSCSDYTKEAVFKYGWGGGLFRGFIRVCRCHPWQKNHYDPLD